MRVHRCTGAEPPAVLSPGPSHCACVPRHAERQTERLLLAEEDQQPAGCVRVYPLLTTTYLLNIHNINSQASERPTSLSKKKVKSELRPGEERKEGRKNFEESRK